MLLSLKQHILNMNLQQKSIDEKTFVVKEEKIATQKLQKDEKDLTRLEKKLNSSLNASWNK